MTPAEHYTEAERLLGMAANEGGDTKSRLIATAQVHATLATVGIINAAIIQAHDLTGDTPS